MSGSPFLRDEYVARINRVIDYIESNIDQELTLKKLAEVASFSPFHFHRIFGAIVGEPLNRFIQRIRLEKAAIKLVGQPKHSITEIALECGFSGSSSFARAFREHFGMSASQWRSRRSPAMSKIGETNSKEGESKSKAGKDLKGLLSYYVGILSPERRKNDVKESMKTKVDVMEIPDMVVAYIRHIGPYKGDTALFSDLFNRLFTWAGARNLLRFPETKVIAVYHDDPDLTDESKLRTSVCITVPEETPVDGEVGKMTVPGGRYAVGHFEIDADEYEQAWNALYGSWLPGSGYQPDDRPPFELYLNDPNEHPEHKHIVDIYLPVKPL